MKPQNPLHSQLLAYIETADMMQIHDLMDAIRRRYRSDFPDWEIIYAAIHRESSQRQKDIDSIITQLRLTQH